MMKWIAHIVLLLLIPIQVISQDYKATMTFDRDEIKLGEQIEATVSLEFPVTDNVDFALPDTLTGEIEIVEKLKIDTNYTGNNLSVKQLSQKLILTSFDTGYHTIPPISFYGKADSMRTEPMLVHVLDVPVEMNEDPQNQEVAIKDIKGIFDIAFSIWEWLKENWEWVAGALLLLVGIWAYFKYLHPKLKQAAPTVIPVKKVDPPHVIAFAQLSELRSKKLWQNGKVKEFHIELSDIVRTYIENGLHIPALESTTDELKRALEHSGINAVASEHLIDSLRMADLAKFAKHQPLGDENDRAFKHAEAFVTATKPVQEPLEQEVNKETQDV